MASTTRTIQTKFIFSQIISDLRDCLHWNITTSNENEVSENQKKVFNCIVRSLSASKQIYDAWLKIIQGTSLDEQKSIDLIILLIMIKVNEDKAYNIEQMVSEYVSTEDCFCCCTRNFFFFSFCYRSERKLKRNSMT